jgi:hypothetical protein
MTVNSKSPCKFEFMGLSVMVKILRCKAAVLCIYRTIEKGRLGESTKLVKGQCHKIFCFWFFSCFPPAPEYLIRTVSNFFEIRGDIRNSRCTTSINNTGGKFATGVNDTGGKIATGINGTGGKLATGINDTSGKLCHQFR